MFWEISETLNVSLLSQQSYIRYKLATRQNAYVRQRIGICPQSLNLVLGLWFHNAPRKGFFITNLYLVSLFESKLVISHTLISTNKFHFTYWDSGSL